MGKKRLQNCMKGTFSNRKVRRRCNSRKAQAEILTQQNGMKGGIADFRKQIENPSTVVNLITRIEWARLQAKEWYRKAVWDKHVNDEVNTQVKKLKRRLQICFFLFCHHVERAYFGIRPTEDKRGPGDNKDRSQTCHVITWLHCT